MFSFTHLLLASSAFLGVFAAPAIENVERESAAESLPDFEISGTNLARRQDYTQNYKTGGNVNFQSTNNGYSVTFSGAQDFVVGRGWKTGTSRYLIISYIKMRDHIANQYQETSPTPARPLLRPEPFSSLYTAGLPTH
jgi:endo-1,4-beta-xylanase